MVESTLLAILGLEVALIAGVLAYTLLVLGGVRI